MLILKNKLKKFLTGLYIRQEYVCLDLVGYKNPLSVFLFFAKTTVPIDVTVTHLFVGYKPVIIAIPFDNKGDYEMASHHKEARLVFSTKAFLQDKQMMGGVIATLDLKAITKKQSLNQCVLFFEATNGHHKFLASFYKAINQQLDNRRKVSSVNINLDGNLYDQVRIAYAIPRIIAIVTVGDDRLMNMFPTDLHGPIGKEHYVSSLRIGGKANDQVENFKNIVISEVSASFYKESYSLGKNHMKDLQGSENFLCNAERSENFNLPLPVAFTRYRELQQIISFDHGIHRIHIYRVVSDRLRTASTTLVHIHKYYAQWRLDHGLSTELLLR